MPSFSKNIHGKNITVHPATHKDGPKEAWGVRDLCPWCGNPQQSIGYTTAKKAADGWFDDLKYHYRAKHKGSKP